MENVKKNVIQDFMKIMMSARFVMMHVLNVSVLQLINVLAVLKDISYLINQPVLKDVLLVNI